MRRRSLTIHALFTLAGAGFGICTGMLFFHDQDDPSRVHIAVGFAWAAVGAVLGLASIALLWTLSPNTRVFETVATAGGATLLAFSVGMATGWALGSNVIGPATERQAAAIRTMKAFGCIGATIGLAASIAQLVFDQIGSRRVRLALVALGVTLAGACVGAALGYIAGQSEGGDLHERARNGIALLKVGTGVGAIIGWSVAVLGLLFELQQEPASRKV